MRIFQRSELLLVARKALSESFPESATQVGLAGLDGLEGLREWRLVLLRPYSLYSGVLARDHGRLASIGGPIDYHTALYEQLEVVITAFEALLGPQPRRFFVDKDGGDDRAWAYATGLVFYGRHQLVIHPELGSAINIGSAALAIPEPIASAWQQQAPNAQPTLCGSCSRCVEACPTNALPTDGPDGPDGPVGPEGAVGAVGAVGALEIGQRGLDLARCRSAINQRKGDLTPFEAELMGEWLYGCDLCQIACPFNKERLVPGVESLPLDSLEGLTNKTFKERYGHRAFAYLGLTRLKRNVALVQDWQDRNR